MLAATLGVRQVAVGFAVHKLHVDLCVARVCSGRVLNANAQGVAIPMSVQCVHLVCQHTLA